MISVMLAVESFSEAVYTGKGARSERLEIGFLQAGNFHLMLQQAQFERFVGVNRNNDAFAMIGVGENVVAAFDAGEISAVLLEEPHEVLS